MPDRTCGGVTGYGSRRARARRVVARMIVALWLGLTLAAYAAAQEPRALPRVAFDDEPVEFVGREIAEPDLQGVPIAVRVPVRLDAPEADGARVRARTAELSRAGLQVWVRVLDLPQGGDEAVRRWRTALRGLAESTRGQVQVLELPLASASEASAEKSAFLLKVGAVQVRALDPAMLVAVSGDRLTDGHWIERFYAAGAGPYADVLAVPANPAGDAQAAGLAAVLQGLGSAARVVIDGERLPDPPPAARATLVRTQLARLGSAVGCTVYRGTRASVESALRGIASLRDLLSDDIVALDERESRLSVRPSTTGSVVHARLLYNLATFGTYLAYWTESGGETPADVSVHLARAGTPMVREPLTGAVNAPVGLTRDEAAGVTAFRITATREPRLVDFSYGAPNEFALPDRTEARRALNVSEIIARYQQAQAAQDGLLESYSARAVMQQHFRPTPADPGYDVVTESRFFSARDGVEWEELSFSVNGTRWGPDRPAFPLLQAEKVLALPLDIRLTADYAYTLVGVETVQLRSCYVVAFSPRSSGSLYRGRVWIDRERFVRLKLHTVQTRLASPFVSNEEIQVFSPVTDAAGHEFFLFSALTARQIALIAGHNLVIEKEVRFADFRVNDPAFTGARNEARGSDRIMFRETERGLRYFVKENGERRVSDRLTTRAKALAMGVTIDPAFGFPLPIVGLNYIDFDFRHKDTQLAVLFGGVLALGNIQRGKLLGGRVDASADFFAIAVPGSDRVYEASGEREGERVLTWPLNAAVNLGWQVTDFQKVGVQYLFRFDGYARDQTTADDFRLPASTITNGAGVTYEWRRAGYALTGSAAWSIRAASEPWGPVSEPAAPEPGYAKYNVSVSKDVFLDAFQKLHFNAAYFGGTHLDRFTQYQFGLFDDTRMHGVPSGGVRFGELVMARGSYAFNVFDQYRLELFLDHAFGRESRQASSWDRLTGTGLSFTMRAPFRTLLRGDIGKSFLPPETRSVGSVVVQILLLKPL